MSEAWLKVKADGFGAVSKLTVHNTGLLEWVETSESGSAPSVYVRVLEPGLDGAGATVLYVGMAGGGWAKRRDEHNTGMRRTHRADEDSNWSKQHEELRTWCQEGRDVIVYERPSNAVDVFGCQTFAQHAEERILIQLLQPRHNRASDLKRTGDVILCGAS